MMPPVEFSEREKFLVDELIEVLGSKLTWCLMDSDARGKLTDAANALEGLRTIPCP